MKKTLLTAAMLSLSLSAAGAYASNSLFKETDVEAIALKVASDTMQTGYKLISVADLKAMIDAKEDFMLIDAHPKNEFDLAYIEGAINFGFQSKRLGNWEEEMTVAGATQDDSRAALGTDKTKKS